MRVSWRKYPNNLGHMNYDGCFRCHDGNHVSNDGKVLTNDCNSCHILLEENSPQKGRRISSEGLQFTHPGGIEVSFKTQKCSACHGVGNKTLEKKVAANWGWSKKLIKAQRAETIVPFFVTCITRITRKSIFTKIFRLKQLNYTSDYSISKYNYDDDTNHTGTLPSPSSFRVFPRPESGLLKWE